MIRNNLGIVEVDTEGNLDFLDKWNFKDNNQNWALYVGEGRQWILHLDFWDHNSIICSSVLVPATNLISFQ